MDGEGPAVPLLVKVVLRGEGGMCEAIWRDRCRLDGIARAARDGNEEARNALCIILKPHLERIAIGMGIVPRDAPDLVQETLITAHLNLDRFDPARGSMRSWVTTILAHLRLNLLRRRARRLRALSQLAERRPGCRRPRRCEAAPAGIGIADALARLSRRQRHVLTIYAIAGLSARETGEILGLSAGGVRSIARDARARLTRARDC